MNLSDLNNISPKELNTLKETLAEADKMAKVKAKEDREFEKNHIKATLTVASSAQTLGERHTEIRSGILLCSAFSHEEVLLETEEGTESIPGENLSNVETRWDLEELSILEEAFDESETGTENGKAVSLEVWIEPKIVLSELSDGSERVVLTVKRWDRKLMAPMSSTPKKVKSRSHGLDILARIKDEAKTERQRRRKARMEEGTPTIEQTLNSQPSEEGELVDANEVM